MPVALFRCTQIPNMLNKVKFGLGLLWVTLLLCTRNTQADEFIIGVEDVSYYPHFDFQQKEAGFAKALLDKFARDHQHSFTYIPLPIKRFSEWLYEEDIDFKYPDNQRWQQLGETHKVKVYFSNDIVRLTAGTLVLAKNRQKPRRFIKNLGTLSGFQVTLWLDSIRQGKVKLLEDPSTRMLIKHLQHGIVDGLDMDYSVVLHQARQMGVKQQIVISDTLPRQNYAFQLSTLRHPKTITQFNLWLQNNHKFLAQLKKQYQIANVQPAH